jgi:hypothetical protein
MATVAAMVPATAVTAAATVVAVSAGHVTKHAAQSMEVPHSTSGVRQPMETPHVAQRPRSAR